MTTWKIALLLSYISIATASAAILTPALPQIESTFSLAHGQVEWMVNIFLIAYTLGQVIYGPLANRIGRLNALRTGFSINLLGIVICLLASYVSRYDWLLVGRFVTALGASAGLCCTFILLNESLSQSRAKHVLSYAIVSFTAGIGIAVLLGGLITQYLHWQWCFWVLLVHGIFALRSVSFFAETAKEKVAISLGSLSRGYAQALSHPEIWTFSLLVALVSLFSYCYSAAAPIIAHNQLHLSPALYGYYNMINIVGMLIGAVVAAKLLKCYDPILLLLISSTALVLGMASLGLLAMIHHLTTLRFFALTGGIYFTTSIIFPSASFRASNAIADKANASGAMNLISMGCAVLGVGIMGYLPISTLWAFIVVSLVFSVMVLVNLIIQQRRQTYNL
jgi:DHA1 family bicyclomycin/chloramphenicol resistance-like MFS transporter